MPQTSRRTLQPNCRVLFWAKIFPIMPGVHAQLIRYRVLHECFSQRGRYWKLPELLARCGERVRRDLDEPDRPDPSVRTFHDDLKRMRSGELGYEAPIDYCRSNRGYYCTDPNFRMDADELTHHDLRQLREALAVLEQMEARVPMLDLRDTLFQLRRRVEDPQLDLSRVVQFERTDMQRGQEWLGVLYNAVRDRQCLQLDYHPYHDVPTVHLFTPLLLKSYNRRWFLIGWHHDHARVEVRPLDRIVGVETVPNRCAPVPARFYERWFQEMVGVTRLTDRRLEEVRIRVDHRLAPYWRSKPLHGTQQEDRRAATARGTVFTLRVYPNYELEMRLLGFGEEVEVLAPASLRARLAERVGWLAARYGLPGGEKGCE